MAKKKAVTFSDEWGFYARFGRTRSCGKAVGNRNFSRNF